jgi:methylphosphotriester-DNA--protein-cysteine methyltransferase
MTAMVLKYIADRSTMTFHDNEPEERPCPEAQDIELSNMIFFQTRAEAEAAGYRPCDRCLGGIFDQHIS